jgi:hypothetical protein
MMDQVIAALFASDQSRRQFADPPRRPARAPATEVVAEPRALVRRTTVRVLRVVADRLEPAPRCVEAH